MAKKSRTIKPPGRPARHRKATKGASPGSPEQLSGDKIAAAYQDALRAARSHQKGAPMGAILRPTVEAQSPDEPLRKRKRGERRRAEWSDKLRPILKEFLPQWRGRDKELIYIIWHCYRQFVETLTVDDLRAISAQALKEYSTTSEKSIRRLFAEVRGELRLASAKEQNTA